MGLLVQPPPNRYPVAPDTTGRYPWSGFPSFAPSYGEALAQSALWGYIPIFGRNGAPPDSQLADWIRTSIEGGSGEAGAWYIGVDAASWQTWYDYTAMGGKRFIGIAVEFRSAEEVQVAGAGHGLAEVFAITGWDGSPNFPPLDGMDTDGLTYSSGWSNMKFLRILIREDLASGGAGPDWDGRAFLVETLAHEFGHAATLMAMELYGSDYVIENLCDLFGKPTSHWADLGIPWDQRVSEANAEFFKDVVFAKRRYNSRAAYRLSRGRFADWSSLCFDYVFSPWWKASNLGSLRMYPSTFGNQIGSCSYIGTQEVQEMRFRAPSFQPSVFEPVFVWPPDGDWRLHWAFDPRPFQTDEEVAGHWDTDLIFAEFPGPGEPNGWTTPKFVVSFYDVNSTLDTLGSSTHYGDFRVEVWSMGEGAPGSGPHGGMPVPPSAGVAEIVVPPGVLAAVPAEGCNAYLNFGGATMPKYDLPGDDYVWPWRDFSLRIARPAPLALAWPYRSTMLHLGTSQPSRIVIPHRVRGRTIRPA